MDSNRFGRSAGRFISAMSRRAAIRRLGGGGLAAGAMFAAAQQATMAQTGVSSAINEAAVRRAIGAVNQALASGDVDLLDAAFAPDYVNHTPHRSFQTGQLQSPDLTGLKTSLGELRTAVPDGVFLIEDIIASGDSVAVRVTFRGTPSPALGIADRALNVGGAVFVRVAGGLIVESWDYDEAAELYAIAPAAPPAPTPTPEPTPAPAEGLASEARDVSGFHAVTLQGVGSMEITQGDTESLTIEAEQRVLDRIESEVRDGRLIIRPARSIRTREPITYRLGVMQLDDIELSGAGRAALGQLKTEQLRLITDGTAAAAISALTATTLEAQATGSSEIALAGTVDSQTVTLGGTSRYNGTDLASRVATVTVQGTGQATVRVSESLQASAAGTGRIDYIGDPSVQQDVSGVGSVNKVG